MCLGVPLKVTEINNKNGVGEINGIIKKFRLDYLKEVNLGDYVMVHAGFAIERISQDTADEIKEVLEELDEKIIELQKERR